MIRPLMPADPRPSSPSRRRRWMVTLLMLTTLAVGARAGLAVQAPSHPLSVDEFLSLEWVSDPQISPDGAWVAYTATTADLDRNRRRSQVWIVPVAGGPARRISRPGVGGDGARWSPDGTALAYLSGDDVPQVMVYVLRTGRARRLTGLSTGARHIVWAPDGSRLGFTSRVYPDCPDDACNRLRLAGADRGVGSARATDELLYRHWTRWDDGRRSHVFVVPAHGGPPADVTAGADYDVPVPPFGDASDYAFSGDALAVFFAAKPGPGAAWRTDSDIFRVPVAGGAARNVTSGMAGGERHPQPSPDGRLLAFLSQRRPGFESDRWRLMVRDLSTGDDYELTPDVDRSVDDFQWLASSRALLFRAQDGQRTAVFRVDLDGHVQRVLRWGNTTAMSVAQDGNRVALVNDAMDRPPQVYLWRLGDAEDPRPLTQVNADVLRHVVMRPAEEIQWVGAEGRTIHGMVVRPPQYRPGGRYPLVVLIHGGPQGAWLDGFHARWNAQLFAAPGYVVELINPRGSTGFGQAFVDQVSRDWGGKVYTDIMAGVEHVARLPFVDSTRLAAAGGSFGGYMVNWINGHSSRFDVLVSHAGVYDLEAFYGATDELWFPEWEFGGTPWANRTAYERWSPHRYADQFRTPTLVIQGGRDYRVPDSQGLQAFTALRRQGVPARLVYFPDEGHWISRPQNQRRWWWEVQGWLARYLGR